MTVPRHAASFGRIGVGLNAQTPSMLTSTRRALPRTHRNALSVKVSAVDIDLLLL
jgi:hypothetical protein